MSEIQPAFVEDALTLLLKDGVTYKRFSGNLEHTLVPVFHNPPARLFRDGLQQRRHILVSFTGSGRTRFPTPFCLLGPHHAGEHRMPDTLTKTLALCKLF